MRNEYGFRIANTVRSGVGGVTSCGTNAVWNYTLKMQKQTDMLDAREVDEGRKFPWQVDVTGRATRTSTLPTIFTIEDPLGASKSRARRPFTVLLCFAQVSTNPHACSRPLKPLGPYFISSLHVRVNVAA